MCRLAYIPSHANITAETLGDLCEHLTRECGGHGCGYAILDGWRVLTCTKAVRADEREQADEIARAVAAGHDAVWHTRLASVGRISDQLCHPFYVAGQHFEGVVAHNGTWRRGAELAKLWTSADGHAHSDSEVFANMLARKGQRAMQAAGDWPDRGVWLTCGRRWKKTIRTARRYGGDLARDYTSGLVASSFPMTWDGEVWNAPNGEFDLRAHTTAAAKARVR